MTHAIKRPEYVEDSGLFFHAETNCEVRRALVRVFNSGERVRLFLGDTRTGQAWPNEFNSMGTIGRSMGPIRVPLLVANSRSMGGQAILDHCIVHIRGTRTNRIYYSHPTFTPGEWDTRRLGAGEYEVTCNNQRHAICHTKAQAERLAGFMAGHRFSK